MHKRLVLTVLLCFATKMTSSVLRHFSDVPLEVIKMEKLVSETMALINDGITNGDNETIRLQTTLNNLHLYFQDSIYLFYKSVGAVQDLELQGTFVSFMHEIQVTWYQIAKVINQDAAQIKIALIDSLKDCIKQLSIAKRILKQPTKEQLQYALSWTKHSYDVAFFNYYIIYIEIKYRKEIDLKIGNEIDITFENAHNLLKQVNAKTVSNSGEFAAFTQLLSKFVDRIIGKIERWGYIYHDNHLEAQMITDVSQALGKTVEDLRKRARINATTPVLRKNIEEFLQNTLTQIKRLSEVRKISIKEGQDIYKDVGLEVLAIVSTLNAKLEILLAST